MDDYTNDRTVAHVAAEFRIAQEIAAGFLPDRAFDGQAEYREARDRFLRDLAELPAGGSVSWSVTGVEVVKFTPGPEQYSLPSRETLGFSTLGFCYEPATKTLTAAVGDAESFEVRSVFDNGLFLALRCLRPGDTSRCGPKNEAVYLDRDRTKPFGAVGIVVSAGDVPTPPPSRLLRPATRA